MFLRANKVAFEALTVANCGPKRAPHNPLAAEERRRMLDLSRQDSFADQAPAEIHASLLDAGVYHCSIRIMYLIS